MVRIQWFGLLLAPAAAIWGCGQGNPTAPPPPPPPDPILSALTPSSTVAGSPDLTLTIHGSNLRGGPRDRSDVEWQANGGTTRLATTFVSSAELTALVPATLLGEPGNVSVFVKTGDPMGQGPFATSVARPFTIAQRPPGLLTVTAIDPKSAPVGTPALTLTISGREFAHNRLSHSQVMWVTDADTTQLATTFVDSTQLTAVLPADLLSRAVNARIYVENRDPVEGTQRTWSNSLSFTVSPASENSGAIEVDVSTRGSGADSSTYTLVVGAVNSRLIRPNGSSLFAGLAPGDYVVQLTDIPPPCVGDVWTSQMVTVKAGHTTRVRFPVTCVEHGTIRVTVNTTGAPLDPDGYTIILDGQVRQRSPVNGTVVFTDVESPYHGIRVDDIAANCWLGKPDLVYGRGVELMDGDTATVRFDLVCLEVGPGAIDVQVQRSGDPFGYNITAVLTRPDGLTRAAPPGTFAGLPVGSYQVGLTGGAPFHIQCEVTPPNPRTLTIGSQTAITTVFQIYCVND